MQAGGISIELATLAIQPTPTTWLAELPNMDVIHQAIFTSPNAVHYFFNALSTANISWPLSIQVTAIGSGSALALKAQGITVHHIPDVSDSEHVLLLNNVQQIEHQTIILVKGDGGRELLEDTLRSRGADLQPILVYRRTLPEKNEEYINSLWRDDAVDIILFTSQQAMQHLFALMGKEAHSWIITKPCLVISARLAEAASVLGIQTIIISPYDAILTTLEGFKHDYPQ